VVRSAVVPDVEPIFLQVPREEIAYVKFVIESYDGIAVTRTLDRHAALLVLLVAPDFMGTARTIVQALANEAGCREVPRPSGCVDLLGEEPRVPSR
jgi:hypothetical protein